MSSDDMDSRYFDEELEEEEEEAISSSDKIVPSSEDGDINNGVDVEGVSNVNGDFAEERIAEDNNDVDDEEEVDEKIDVPQVDTLLTGEHTSEESEFEVIEEVAKENEAVDEMEVEEEVSDLSWESTE